MSTPAITVTNVSRTFTDGTTALHDVSFTISTGEFAVIAGSNGSGKSVLMSLIAQLDEPTTGTIELHQGDVGLVFQDADAQILGETPAEDIAFGVKNCGIRGDGLWQAVDEALERVGLQHKRDAGARFLSGGEKRRLAVAGILAMNRTCLVFDEPFANLDWIGVRQVCAILKQLKEEGHTIILLTHELEKCLALADRFLVLDRGTIRFDGSVEQGLQQNLEQWSIRNPLIPGQKVEDLLWL